MIESDADRLGMLEDWDEAPTDTEQPPADEDAVEDKEEAVA